MPKRKYPLIQKHCPVCLAPFEASLGSPKEKQTCSYSCSSSLRIHSDETKRKIAESLLASHQERNPELISKANPKIKQCTSCLKDFESKHKKYRFCSKQCVIDWRPQNSEYRKNLSIASRKAIAEGRHKGWLSRDKLQRSFPERYIETLLEKEFDLVKGREYTPELKQGKWFIDFAFVARKLALEIDGKQHEYEERKASDIAKDKYLVEQGWTIHRIKWKRVQTKEHREAVISTLKQILSL